MTSLMGGIADSIKRGLHSVFKENERKLHPLNYLFWECTQRCNLACLHCGSDCKADARVPDMPFDDFFNAVRPLADKYGGERVTVVITGGEPLLRHDLAECGRRLADAGFGWGIVTNGYAYDESRHRELLSAGMGAATVSFDGPEAMHNHFRGGRPRSFANAVRAIDLIASSPQLNYDVVTCVHKQNLGALPELRSFLIGHRVKAWRLFTIAPIGRAAHNDSLQLDGRELRQMMDFIAETREEGKIDLKFSCEAYTGDYELKVRDWFFFCRAGVNIASVLIDGSICACPNVDRSFAQGNIYTDDFLDVWENRFQEMRDRSWMRNRGMCAGCKAWKRCEGGAMHLWTGERDGIMECLYSRMCNG